jgi:hypothetical protein
VTGRAYIAALIACALSAAALASPARCGAGRTLLERASKMDLAPSFLEGDCPLHFETGSVAERMSAAFAPVGRGARGFSIVSLAPVRSRATVHDVTSGPVAPGYRNDVVGGWAGVALGKIGSSIRPFNLPSDIGVAVQYAF